MLRWVGRNSKRVGITIVGFVLLLGGIAGLALPILPGWLLIIAGLAVLGTEYMWARRMLEAAKRKAKEAADKVRRKKGGVVTLDPADQLDPLTSAVAERRLAEDTNVTEPDVVLPTENALGRQRVGGEHRIEVDEHADG